MELKLKIAIQKSGRLFEGSLKLLEECGITVNTLRKDKLKTEALNFPLEVYFLRDDDIPQYIEDKVADVGIVGENVVIEKNKQINIVHRLGFSRCRLALAVPRHIEYTGLEFFQNKRIATSYPFILEKYMRENGIVADIHEISGSVEIAPSIGLADAICDLVSSGSTLFSNGLTEVQSVLQSEAVLVAANELSTEKRNLLDKLIFRIKAIQRAKHAKYILLNAPNENIEVICSLLPGMKSPTVTPLHDKGWSSIQSVVYENTFWEIIDKLQAYGAEGILVTPIEKMI